MPAALQPSCVAQLEAGRPETPFCSCRTSWRQPGKVFLGRPLCPAGGGVTAALALCVVRRLVMMRGPGIMWAILLLALAGAAAQTTAPAEAVAVPAPQPLFSATPLPQQRCADAVPVEGLNLTAAERALLPFICWPMEGLGAEAAPRGPTPAPQPRGVPAGVNCTVVSW